MKEVLRNKLIIVSVGAIFAISLLVAIAPTEVFADAHVRVQKDQGLIIPCDTNCTWSDLYILVKKIIDFCLFYLAIPLSVISIAWAGWLYLVAGFNESNKTKAKEILTGVLIGLVFALGAWLIVHFIVDALVKPEVAEKFPTELKTTPTP